MVSLDNSIFFDDHALKVLSSILEDRPITAINEDEKELLDVGFEIRSLEKDLHEMSGQHLFTLVRSSKKYISVLDLIFFLINSRRLKKLDFAIELVKAAVENKRYLSDDMLYKSLEMSDQAPAGIVALLTGDSSTDRFANEPELPKREKSSVDFSNINFH